MAWEKLYVEEAEMTFRFVVSQSDESTAPFQFCLTCLQQENGDWLAKLAQEDPKDNETEISIANKVFVCEKGVSGIEAIQFQAFVAIIWATNFINKNYRLSIQAIAPNGLPNELYQPW